MAAQGGRVRRAAGPLLGHAAVTGLADNAVPARARGMDRGQVLALLLAGFAALRPAASLRPRNRRAVLLRALVHAAAIACFHASVSALTLPQALPALFTAPRFAAGFDALLRRRWTPLRPWPPPAAGGAAGLAGQRPRAGSGNGAGAARGRALRASAMMTPRRSRARPPGSGSTRRAGALHYLCLPAAGFRAWAIHGWLPWPAEVGGMGLIALAGLIALGDASGRLI